MLEFIVSERCTGCNTCVDVCPTNVFEIGAAGMPVIARVDDCQTCFMCELYCDADALYVGPDRERLESASEAEIVASGLLGQLRRDAAWGEWKDDPRYQSQYWQLGPYLTAGMKQQAERTLRRQAERQAQDSAE